MHRWYSFVIHVIRSRSFLGNREQQTNPTVIARYLSSRDVSNWSLATRLTVYHGSTIRRWLMTGLTILFRAAIFNLDICISFAIEKNKRKKKEEKREKKKQGNRSSMSSIASMNNLIIVWNLVWMKREIQKKKKKLKNWKTAGKKKRNEKK